jgi:choice-of-anchor C domain-containing protein
MTAVLVLSIFCFSSNVSADPVLLNGSFENGVPPFDSHDIDIVAGSTAITGWTVIGGGVDLLEDPWDVSDGLRAVDLDRRSPGGIEQSFATLVGDTYIVSFDLSGNPQGGSRFKPLRVSVGGLTSDFVFDSAGQTIDALIWQAVVFSFVATNTVSTLRFESLSSSDSSFGALIDHVDVSSVPEPSTLVLVATGLVIGRWRLRGRH